ncbi:MAG TPA: J domain-containing protein [Methylocella sp.]|nr:J domain-containing protein [Methylocella sp.]
MDLRSRVFDRIRVKPRLKDQPRAEAVLCEHPGCGEAGNFRAPKGRLREGEYFCFCLDHVKEYNASYNYFHGMSAEALAQYQRDSVIGHRPTWTMGVKRGSKNFMEDVSPRTLGDRVASLSQKNRGYFCETPQRPRYGLAARKALDQLGLDDNVDMATIKSRYKDLVKRLHPDANAGDRSNEEKLREIIRAYNYLRAMKLA